MLSNLQSVYFIISESVINKLQEWDSLNVALKWDFEDDHYLGMDNLQYRFVAILH